MHLCMNELLNKRMMDEWVNEYNWFIIEWMNDLTKWGMFKCMNG